MTKTFPINMNFLMMYIYNAAPNNFNTRLEVQAMKRYKMLLSVAVMILK